MLSLPDNGNKLKILSLALLIFLFLCIFFLFFKATCTFPKCSDDFSYSYIYGNGDVRVKTISDIITSQVHHFLTWGGRFWTHSVVQYLLMYDKWVFNIANVLVYALSTYYISRIGKVTFHPWYWLLSAASFWCIMPASGTTMFWLTGSVNYLWSSCLNAIFLYAIYSGRNKPNVLILPLGFLAGNAHEGISVGIAVAITIFLLAFHHRARWIYVLAALCYISGCLSNLMAPGNFVRLETFSNGEIGAFPLDIFAKFYLNTRDLILQTKNSSDIGRSLSMYMFGLSVLSFFRLLFLNKRKAIITGSLIAGSLSSIALNIYTGTTYPRASFGFCFISYILFLVSIPYTFRSKSLRYANITLFILILALNAYELPKAKHAIQAMSEQIEKIRSEVQKGNQIIAISENFEKADIRYLESWGIGNNAIYNRPLSKYYKSVNFAVVNKEQKHFIEDNILTLKDVPSGQILHLPDNYHAIKITYPPARVNIALPPKDIPYRFSFVREYTKRCPRSLHPIVISYHENYFIIWQTAEKAYSISIKSKENTIHTFIQAE